MTAPSTPSSAVHETGIAPLLPPRSRDQKLRHSHQKKSYLITIRIYWTAPSNHLTPHNQITTCWAADARRQSILRLAFPIIVDDEGSCDGYFCCRGAGRYLQHEDIRAYGPHGDDALKTKGISVSFARWGSGRLGDWTYTGSIAACELLLGGAA